MKLKWIGQHIFDLIARFRGDVYIEDLSSSTETTALVVDSSGKVTTNNALGGSSEVVDDATPQLGGDLDVNGRSITSAGNGDITIDPDGTGSIILRSNDVRMEGAGSITVGELKLHEMPLFGSEYVGFMPPPTLAASQLWMLPTADGTVGQLMKTDGAGALGWVDPSSDTSLGDTDQTLTGNRSIILNGNDLLIESAAGVGEVRVYSNGYLKNKGRLMVDGHVTSGAYLKLSEGTNNGINGIILQAAASMASNLSLVLPDSDGTSGQALTTDGSGNLSFSTVGGGGGASYWNETLGGYKTGWSNSTSYYTFYRVWYENWSNSDDSPTSISYNDYISSFFTAPRAGSITNIKVSGYSSNTDPFKFHFYKAGSSNGASSVALTFLFSSSAITPSAAYRTWSYSEDFSTGNTFAEDDRIFVFIKKDSSSGSSSTYWNININGEY